MGDEPVAPVDGELGIVGDPDVAVGMEPCGADSPGEPDERPPAVVHPVDVAVGHVDGAPLEHEEQVLRPREEEVHPRGEREKALKILAKSIFRELRTQGYDAREIVSLSTELLSLITTDIKPTEAK